MLLGLQVVCHHAQLLLGLSLCVYMRVLLGLQLCVYTRVLLDYSCVSSQMCVGDGAQVFMFAYILVTFLFLICCDKMNTLTKSNFRKTRGVIFNLQFQRIGGYHGGEGPGSRRQRSTWQPGSREITFNQHTGSKAGGQEVGQAINSPSLPIMTSFLQCGATSSRL